MTVTDGIQTTGRTLTLGAGQTLFREGDPADSLYLLVEGKVDVCVDGPGGEPHRLATLTAGAVIGECGVLAGQPRTATVVARTDSELSEVSRESFLAAAEAGQSWAVRLLLSAARELAERLRTVDSQLRELATETPSDGPSEAKRVVELQRLRTQLLEWSF